MEIRQLIDNKDYQGIEQALTANPSLANEGLPYDRVNQTKAHPLHRLCDGVFSGTYTDEEAVEMAKLFLAHGAHIDGGKLGENQDTPLTAAASLHADQLAFFYIDHGANINHRGCHGGTALHWAAWCGRDKVVEKLILAGAEINQQCLDFKATPLFWAVHGLKNGGSENLHDTLRCVKILLHAGADKNIPNAGGETIYDLLTDEDQELKEVLNAG
ncbi:Ankyrin repeat-containing protein [bacterium A37T11]|nr:Ankyrin repeat-containing protein [bacterium A37T11]